MNNNIFSKVTLKIWDKWKTKSTRKINPFMPLTNYNRFSDDLENILKRWRSQNLNTLKDISTKGVILAKGQIEDKVKDRLLWIHYFQMRSVLSKKEFQTNLKNDYTPFEQLLASQDNSTKRKLSLIYHIMLASVSSSLDSHKRKWGKDCNLTLSQDDWMSIDTNMITKSKFFHCVSGL